MLRRWESETKKVELPLRKIYVSNVSPMPERVVSAVVAYCCTCPEVGSIGSQSVYNLVKRYGRHFRPHARGQPKSLSKHHIFIISKFLAQDNDFPALIGSLRPRYEPLSLSLTK